MPFRSFSPFFARDLPGYVRVFPAFFNFRFPKEFFAAGFF